MKMNNATHSTMLFSPLYSNLIPEGNVFVDFGDIAEVATLSEGCVWSTAGRFRETHGHFIVTVFYSKYVRALQKR